MSNHLNQVNFRDRRAWHATHLRFTDQKIVEQQTILEELQNNFPFIWERLKDPSYIFTTIFVGAANGEIEVPLMKEFQNVRESQEHLEFFSQDISPLMREEFYSHADKFNLTDSLKTYDLYRFEDSRYLPPQADFVLASHSWCYISGWRHQSTNSNSLIKFANLLKPLSIGLINLPSKNSDRLIILSNYLSSEGTYSEISSEDVTHELDRLGIPYTAIIVESKSDISSCFRDGIFNPNMDGKMLLSFWLRTWWDDVSAKGQKQIINDLNLVVSKNTKEELVFRDSYIRISTD